MDKTSLIFTVIHVALAAYAIHELWIHEKEPGPRLISLLLAILIPIIGPVLVLMLVNQRKSADEEEKSGSRNSEDPPSGEGILDSVPDGKSPLAERKMIPPDQVSLSDLDPISAVEDWTGIEISGDGDRDS